MKNDNVCGWCRISHNKDKCEKALAEIATELDATKVEVKAKILNLRSKLG